MLKKRLLSLVLCLALLAALPAAFAESSSEPATRGQVCDMLLAAADDYSPGLTRDDIIKGYPDGETYDDQYITRAEAFVMISRAFGTLPTPVGSDLRQSMGEFHYTGVPDWALEDVENLANARVVVGSGDGKLNEEQLVTVEQVETVIRRIWALLGTNLRDDFYNTVNKAWLNSSVIAAGEADNGSFSELDVLSTANLVTILSEILSTEHAQGTKERKISDFYNSVLDMDTRNAQGIAPIKPYLDAIDAVDSMDTLYAAGQKLLDGMGLFGLISASISAIDPMDSTAYAMYFAAVIPALPKEIYAAEDSSQAQAYRQYLVTVLELAGDANPQKNADAYFAMEKALSEKQLDPQDSVYVDKTYNPYTVDELQTLYPNIDLKRLITDSGYQLPDKIIVKDKGLMEAFAEYYKPENLTLLKTALKLMLVLTVGDTLSQAFVDASNVFQADFLGVDGAYSIEEIALLQTQAVMNDYLGEIYINEYFSPEAKRDVENITKELIGLFRVRIQQLDWMSDTTKQMALKKLDTMNIMIGYPDSWETSMDKIEIGSSYFENMVAISRQDFLDTCSLQGETVDRATWAGLSVYTSNAGYVASLNSIIFPAGILQAPFYDINASREANLGGIGVVIGHEITHAFDNNGGQFDEKGNALNWWTEADYQKFEALCNEVVAYYDGYEIAPGILSKGDLTLGENIADLGGVAVALDAMKKISNPNYDTFFRSFAVIFKRTFIRPALEYYNAADVHSREMARINRAVQSFDEFYKTYNVTENDGMYTADRIKVW